MSTIRIALSLSIVAIVVTACGSAASVDTSNIAMPTSTIVSANPGTTEPVDPVLTAAPTTVSPSTTVPPTAVPPTTDPTPDPVKRDRIEVNSPQPGDTIENPLVVTGESMTESGLVHFRLVVGGDVIAQGLAQGGSAGVWAPFSATLEFTNDCCIEMLLEVFEVSPIDGAQLFTVKIPLTYPERS